MNEVAGEAERIVAAKAGKYLTFQLGEEVYGIGILQVQEIIGLMRVTHVPQTPGFIRGVINLRGKVIPVVDMRLKFGLDAHEDTERTCTIVVQVGREAGRVTIGIVVDEVSEVLRIEEGHIEPPPSFGRSVNTDFLLGMGKVGEKVIMLLDVDRVFSREEIAVVGGIG
jgi:purine-binding chemotaxis protein CheW